MFTNPQAPVSLLEILAHRENRASLQNRLLKLYKKPIISFTLNIPGPIKVSDDTKIAFQDGYQSIYETLEKHHISIRTTKELHSTCGDEVILSVDAPSKILKHLMVEIEETNPYGRLFDIDVLNEQGEKESRLNFRSCLICEHQAQDCARNRTHTVKELQMAVLHIIHGQKQKL